MQAFELQQVDYDDAYANGTTNGIVDVVFKKVAKNSTGFHIWRIDNMSVVPLTRDQYGTFYDADSYIIYASSQQGQACGTDTVCREIRGATLEYHIHFWLGNATAADKSGVAAYKTVELDGYLGGSATQHRETQGNESARFKSYFKNGFRILKGSQSTNTSDQNTTINNKQFHPRLYKVKGKRNPVVIQQESVSWKHFNSGDVFLILTEEIIFVWVGRAGNGIEKLHATKTAMQLKNETNVSRIVFVDDGYEQSIQNEDKLEFQKFLPLNQRHVLPSDQIDDESAEKNYRGDIRLYRCSDNSGKYRVTELKSGPLMQNDLDSDDVFILDHGLFGIWVWVGKRANDKERSEAMRNARGFVKKKKYPNETTVTKVNDGAEPIEFKMLFISWRNKEDLKGKPITANKTTKMAITKFDANLMHDRPVLAAETQLLDDGSGTARLWRINNKEAVEISKEKFGNFFNGDSYLIWYNYQNHGQRHVLYTWFGLHASQEEITNASAKAAEIDNELGGIAFLIRVIQGREPAHFLQIFKGKLTIFRGKGIDSDDTGRNSKTPSNYLLHIQGSASYNTKATQVATKATSLNSNYCFVLRKSKRYFIWSGLNSTGDQREMAKHFTGKDFELALEGKEPQEFWDLLGGKQDYVTNKVSKEEGDLKNPRLFHCFITSNTFKVDEVFNFNQTDLIPEDTMLLDAHNAIFVWMGKLSTAQDRKHSFEMALDYLKTDPTARDINTPIVQIKQGNEPPIFTGFFKSWDSNWWTEHISFDELRCQLEGTESKREAHTNTGKEDDFDKYEKYPVSMLRESTDKLPNKVDPLQKELYLTHDDFVFIFKMKYQEFKTLPKWKQQELKKKAGLF